MRPAPPPDPLRSKNASRFGAGGSTSPSHETKQTAQGGLRCFEILRLGDILNTLVFRGGAFGMGIAASCAHIGRLLVLQLHFSGKRAFFLLSPKLIRTGSFSVSVRGRPPSGVGHPLAPEQIISATTTGMVSWLKIIVV